MSIDVWGNRLATGAVLTPCVADQCEFDVEPRRGLLLTAI